MPTEQVLCTPVYAFEWCDCVFESGFSVISLHASKRGALKAMVREANSRWLELRTQSLQYGTDGYDPLTYQSWRVRSIALEA